MPPQGIKNVQILFDTTNTRRKNMTFAQKIYMKQLVFATGNRNKVSEMNDIIGQYLPVVSMGEVGCTEDLPETQDTLEGNAVQKADYLYDNYGQIDCFSEDTGLEVDALGGAPGVLTARYAGETKDPVANMTKLLTELGDTTQRGAQFRTIICLILGGEKVLFEGICRGHIAQQMSGTGGFGYDPVFIPEGYQQTFADLDKNTKHSVSHRGKALRKLQTYLSAK